jgi:hypothetical protein
MSDTSLRNLMAYGFPHWQRGKLVSTTAIYWFIHSWLTSQTDGKSCCKHLVTDQQDHRWSLRRIVRTSHQVEHEPGVELCLLDVVSMLSLWKKNGVNLCQMRFLLFFFWWGYVLSSVVWGMNTKIGKENGVCFLAHSCHFSNVGVILIHKLWLCYNTVYRGVISVFSWWDVCLYVWWIFLIGPTFEGHRGQSSKRYRCLARFITIWPRTF